MSQPSFWRDEIWHPLTVHFPVALLLLATITFLVALFLKRSRRHTWELSGSLLLFTGSLGAWIAIYTGNIADGAVARTICDPTILKTHENASYTTAYLFTSASLVNLFMLRRMFNDKLQSVFKYGLLLLMLSGSGYLVYTGHLGATLVYQQGAGVNKPGADCMGF